ncbi:MAG: chemotaxis protein CheW [Candidatus Riflebacteria bacterium]
MANESNLVESMIDQENNMILVCEVAETVLGISTAHIQEVLAIPDIRPVHHAPAYIKGLFNLRGRVLSLIDPAVKLELKAQTIFDESRILVIQTGNELVGLLVESLHGIFPATATQTTSNPENLQESFQKAISGFCFIEDKMVGLVKIDELLDRDLIDGNDVKDEVSCK